MAPPIAAVLLHSLLAGEPLLADLDEWELTELLRATRRELASRGR
jgi:hypothetical protein